MEPHITVNGTSMVSADPDRCRIDLRVSVSSPSVDEATRTMSAVPRAVLDALRDAGAGRVSTGRFAIRPDHERQGQPMRFAPRPLSAPRSSFRRDRHRPSPVCSRLRCRRAASSLHRRRHLRALRPRRPGKGGVACRRLRFQESHPGDHRLAGASVGEVVTAEEETRAAPGPVRSRAVGTETAAIPVEPRPAPLRSR